MKHSGRGGVSALLRLFLVAEVVLMASSGVAVGGKVIVSLTTDSAPGLAARHGLKKLEAALGARGVAVKRVGAGSAPAAGGIRIAAGLASGSGQAANLLKASGVAAPAGPEALVIRRVAPGGQTVLLICGSDDRGLMYALLDTADRVGWAADADDPLSEVNDIAERPDVPERALSKYTMHRAHFESYFHDEKYWARFLDMLAANRFNTFALLFAYENAGYFAPPYPYFCDVEGFDDVRVVGITKAEQKRNLESLNRLIRMTHERGLSFTLGIWDHIYRGGVQGPTAHARKPTKGLVWGVTRKNLVPYTKAALAKFLGLVPDLDAVQFRMHGESGLKRSEMPVFWTDIYKIMKTHAPGVRFDARAKNFPHSLIDKAVEMNVPIRMCTKYWMEQMGMPFHPTHVHPRNQHDRRHGYADMLRYPRRYKMHWRLWNGGTTRILLWGDPEYVRRFSLSTHLYDGDGFEVNEPLATKMQDHPHDKKPFDLLAAKYRYYDWEFERYWHFFQVWGRVAYNPNTPPEVWGRQFEKRFGKAAGPIVQRALHRASRILPRAVTYSYPYYHFPTTRGWVEKQRQGDLPAYARSLPSDTQQFLSMDTAARCRLDGTESAKIHPERSAEWFARASRDVLELVGQAEKQIAGRKGKEFVSTMVDLRILANLALYHSHRARAGFCWALFQRSGDVNALDDAIGHEGRAVGAWEAIVAAAGDVYHDDLMMGRRRSGLSGHWTDELASLKRGLEALGRQRDAFRPKPAKIGPAIAHVPVRKAPPGKAVRVRATVSGPAAIKSVRVAYGKGKAVYARAEMKRAGPMRFEGAIPASAVTEGLRYFIEATDDARSQVAHWSERPGVPIAVTVTSDNDPPAVSHEPVTSAPAQKPLTILAEVTDPSGVKWVRLRYRIVNQTKDYKTLEMKPTRRKGRYAVTVPGEELPRRWDFMYLIEVMDRAGNGKIHPDLDKEAPYVVVKLKRGGR